MILPTNLTAEEIYDAAAAAGARPDPLLTISQWADRYRWLSQRASAEHGRWRTERTPYLREIMDCLSPSSLIERVAFMKGAQIGGTECGNNWMGYVIHQAPGPMMSVQPTVEMAKRNSKQRIEPLIEESEVLRKLVRDPRSRDSGNTVLSKNFPGGVLVMTGANSAVGLRSMAARYLFLDEVDAYPGDVEGEGDPITLAMARTRTFARRKVFLVSTPKITGMSRIESAYEESDQRKYWVPCPTCREFQILKFAQLRWPKGDPQSAAYVCEHCSQEIRNHFPSDEEWTERQRRRKVIIKQLGRGVSETIIANGEDADAALLAKVRTSEEDAPEVDAFEASRIIEQLSLAEVDDVVQAGDAFRVTLRVLGGTVTHVLKMASAKDVTEYRRGFARVLDLPYNRQELTINLAAAGTLYKKLITTAEGYSGEAPVMHQAVAVKAAIDALDAGFQEPGDPNS